ncbi:GSCOCG00012386001-RA-CDS, partial [Cotesia congregata]
MDIQFILDMYSCASYVLNYLNKSISDLSRLIEFGSQEAVYYILALPLSKFSRDVIFINTNDPENRIQVVKSKRDLEKLPLNSTDIYVKSTLDHYISRPHELENICLASFVSWYNYSTKEYHEKNKICSDEEDDNDDLIDNSVSLKLIDNSGFVRKRKKSKIIRFINYNEQIDKDNFIRENVIIFQSSKPFGGISVIVFGDFNQLAPVGDRYIFHAHSMDLYGDIIGNPLWNLFTSYQLTEIMRQKDDFKFAEALNNLADGTLSKNDLKLFESRIVHNNNDIPKDAIHLFRTNDEVDNYNEKIINKDVFRKNIIAVDKITGKCSNKVEQNLINYCKNIGAKDTKGLPSNLSLSIGIEYVLTVNIDVEDGLVNGAVGILKGFELNDNKEIFRLWFDFSDDQIGKKKRKEVYKDGHKNWTAIDKITK